MAKWRKKPLVIEADVYEEGMEDGFNTVPLSKLSKFGFPVMVPQRKPYINTPEGRSYISEGDYICIGIKGEKYPCNKEVFEASYDRVEEE